jgi:DNA modification methylase
MTNVSESPPTDTDQHISIGEFAGKPKPQLRQISFLAIADLTSAPHNPRKHTRAQVRAIARSIEAFGFNAPILIDKNRQIVAGHGRYEASKLLKLSQVPVIFLDHLSETQAKAYMLADNKLTDRSTWDDAKVAVQLKELSEIVLDFDIEAVGFELPEIDLRIQSLDAPDETDRADEFDKPAGPAVSVTGDLWLLGPHRLYCGNALDPTAYAVLMESERAAAVFTDQPYNLEIDGHVGGNGRIKHREFLFGSGEMSKEEFANFLATGLKLMCDNAAAGAVFYACMDWRHMGEMLAAGDAAGCELLNVCVWIKSNAGMGSFYRSRHEMVFVFRNGKAPHLNNVQLGRFGRNRPNTWFYPGVNSFARKGAENALSWHPTVKPLALVADAVLDCSKRGDIILDPFAGSGTTILAAERTGRRGFGIEIDAIYVDTAIARWEKMTGQQARTAHGVTFAQMKSERSAGQ